MSSSAETTSGEGVRLIDTKTQEDLKRALNRAFDRAGTVLEQDLRRVLSRFSPPDVDAAVPVADVSGGSLPPVRQVQEISSTEHGTTTAPAAVSYLQIRDGGEEYLKYRDDAYRKHETLVKSEEKDLARWKAHSEDRLRSMRRKLDVMYNKTWTPAAETETREQLDGTQGAVPCSCKQSSVEKATAYPIAGTLQAVAGDRTIQSITFKGGSPNTKNDSFLGNLRYPRVPGIFVALVADGPCLVSDEQARYWYPADRENPAMPKLVLFGDFCNTHKICERKCTGVRWVAEPDREVQLSHVLDCVQRRQPAAVGEGYWLATMEDDEQALAFDNSSYWWPIPGTKRAAVSVTYLQVRDGDQGFEKYRVTEAYEVWHMIIERMEADLASMLQLKSEHENDNDFLWSAEFTCLLQRIRDKRRDIETASHHTWTVGVDMDIL